MVVLKSVRIRSLFANNWLSVLLPCRNHTPHAASWIRHVVVITRNEVKVHMRYSLTSTFAYVDAYVKAIGVKFSCNQVFNLVE